jgi:hypothetical protein
MCALAAARRRRRRADVCARSPAKLTALHTPPPKKTTPDTDVRDQNAFDDVQEDASLGGAAQLKRCLGLFDLILFGVAAIIGAGIFVVTGLEAKINAG